MSIIREHKISILGKLNGKELLLRPLSDEHLPLLYKWNSDSEVLYWVDGEDVDAYPPEVVNQIYGNISQNNFCFAVEFDGEIIGECWLQRMNLPNVIKMYPAGMDVRRIDMCIGEKEYWSKGIGTALVEMLAEFAFWQEQVDVLHCFCEDYNHRSSRVWEKNGFTLALREPIPQPSKGKYQEHWRITKEEFFETHE